jgi:hypothetical protein
MSDLLQFFAQFKEMAQADPWQFGLLVLCSGVVGWVTKFPRKTGS